MAFVVADEHSIIHVSKVKHVWKSTAEFMIDVHECDISKPMTDGVANREADACVAHTLHDLRCETDKLLVFENAPQSS